MGGTIESTLTSDKVDTVFHLLAALIHTYIHSCPKKKPTGSCRSFSFHLHVHLHHTQLHPQAPDQFYPPTRTAVLLFSTRQGPRSLPSWSPPPCGPKPGGVESFFPLSKHKCRGNDAKQEALNWKVARRSRFIYPPHAEALKMCSPNRVRWLGVGAHCCD
jgi:hypothetical protein